MSIIEESGPDSSAMAAVRAETARLLSAPQFVSAPVMRRLLSYLVDQTLAGNGDRLKAYTVAVDGLGRDADFDAGQDSYPRVQVGRLRKLLDDVYDSGGSRKALRIHIPKGAYAVHFDTPADRERVEAEEAPADVPKGRRFAPSAERWRMAIVAVAAAFIALGAWQLLEGFAAAGADDSGAELTEKDVG